MTPTKLISLVPSVCLAIAAFASSTAHADARTQVLRELNTTPLVPGSGGWQPNKANGTVGTWDDTDDNTLVSVVHTPMNSWGLSVDQRLRTRPAVSSTVRRTSSCSSWTPVTRGSRCTTSRRRRGW